MQNGSIRAPTYRSTQTAVEGVGGGPAVAGVTAIDATSLHSTSAISTRPPSYGRHLHDELLSPPGLIPYRSGAGRARPRSTASVASSTCHITQMLQILTSTDPLVLTVDNNLLYPPPPSTALYHLPRLLTWSGTEISLARSLPFSRRGARFLNRQARDLALYTMRRTPFTNEIVLVPRREGLKAAVMRGHRSLLGNMTWVVEVRGAEKPLLTYNKGRWKVFSADGSGRIIAKERMQTPISHMTQEDGATKTDSTVNVITIEGHEVDLWLKDLVVAAWCCRIWQSHKMSGTRTLFRRSFMAGRKS
jgi:hypothetical protein